MRTSILVIVLAVAVVVWLPAGASAQDGGGLGACAVDFTAGNQAAVECVNDVTASFCSCPSCNWFGNTDCTELKFPWEGSCFFDNTPPPDGGCWLWTVEAGAETAEFHCEAEGGSSWSDDLVCGGAPVPTLPKAAYAALALVLLAGSLTLLTLYSRP